MLERLTESLDFQKTSIDKEEFFVHKRCPYPRSLDESNALIQNEDGNCSEDEDIVVGWEDGEEGLHGKPHTSIHNGDQRTKQTRKRDSGVNRVFFDHLAPEFYQIPRDCQNIDYVEDVSVIGFPGLDAVRKEVLGRACGGRWNELEKVKMRRAKKWAARE